MTFALFWAIGAALVAIVQVTIDPLSPTGAAIASAGVLLLTAYAYVRSRAQDTTVDHALGVGIAWLALAIVSDMAMTQFGYSSFGILGSPEQPLWRTLVLFSWIFSPAVFARQR